MNNTIFWNAGKIVPNKFSNARAAIFNLKRQFDEKAQTFDHNAKRVISRGCMAFRRSISCQPIQKFIRFYAPFKANYVNSRAGLVRPHALKFVCPRQRAEHCRKVQFWFCLRRITRFRFAVSTVRWNGLFTCQCSDIKIKRERPTISILSLFTVPFQILIDR